MSTQEPRSAVGAESADRFKIIHELTEDLKAATKGGRFGSFELCSGSTSRAPVLLTRARQLAQLIKRIRGEFLNRPEVGDRATSAENLRELVFLRACTWVAEVLEYFGCWTEAREIVEKQGRFAYASLVDIIRDGDASLRADPVHQQLARQKVWCALHYAYCCLYLQNEHPHAMRVLEGCEDVVGVLRSDAFPCFYSLSRIASLKAAVLRQLGKLDAAQASYEEALELIYRRLESELEKHSDEAERAKEETTRANYEAAKVLALGVGFTLATRGLLKEARLNVMTALLMLASTGDVLRSAYARLLLASIERAEAGFDATRLRRTMEMLKGPRRVFLQYHHPRYVSRVEYELALAKLYLAQAIAPTSPAESRRYCAEAERDIRRVLNSSQTSGNDRWEVLCYIVSSRVARLKGDASHAAEFARRALASAASVSNDIQAEAHIAYGEVCLSAGKVKDALANFKTALSLAVGNFKAHGACQLHLADAYLTDGNVQKAVEHFELWKTIRDHVQHGIVRDMATEIEQRITEAARSWLLLPLDRSLNYAEHERTLRSFLIAKAAARGKGVDAIANQLGIKRATYYNWVRELAPSPMGTTVERLGPVKRERPVRPKPQPPDISDMSR